MCTVDITYSLYEHLHSQNGQVIFAGDFNASLLRELHTNNINSFILCKFVKRCNFLTPLVDFSVYGQSFSFIPKQTMLDYILLSQDITNCHDEILEEGSISSTSDHLPVVCNLETHTKRTICKTLVLYSQHGTRRVVKPYWNMNYVPVIAMSSYKS